MFPGDVDSGMIHSRRHPERIAAHPVSQSPGRSVFPALVLLLLLATPVWGQDPPSILELLPTGDRTIQVGTPATGMLGTPTDYRLPDGQPVQAWEVRGEPGSWIWIDLVSDEFDAYLFVVNPERDELLMDDDSGGGCHARIPVEIPSGGRVIAIAGQVGLRLEGTFTLTASPEQLPTAPEPCAYASDFGEGGWFEMPDDLVLAGRFESIPGEVAGTLAPDVGPPGPQGASMVSWDAELVAGQTIQIDLSSDAFDTILLMTGPGIQGHFEDDDGGEGLNSRLTFTVLLSGTYQLHVTGFGPESSGAYRLAIAEILPPG
jgi:hypothetical protein